MKYWIAQGHAAVDGQSQEAFMASPNSFHAGNWCIICVGEVARNILKSYGDFPSAELRDELMFANATRNRIAHGYFDLDGEQVWATITISFVNLAAALDASLLKGRL